MKKISKQMSHDLHLCQLCRHQSRHSTILNTLLGIINNSENCYFVYILLRAFIKGEIYRDLVKITVYK